MTFYTSGLRHQLCSLFDRFQWNLYKKKPTTCPVSRDFMTRRQGL